MRTITRKTNPIVGADGRARGPICPVSRQRCLGERCAWWSDDWGTCVVSTVGLYNQIRDAATDAAVEVMRAYHLMEGG